MLLSMLAATCRRVRITFLVATAAFATGCSLQARSLLRDELRIHTHPDTVLLQTVQEGRGFVIGVVMRNVGRSTLFVDMCGPVAERHINGNWEVVWRPECLGSIPREVPPSDSLVHSVLVFGFYPGRAPTLDPRLLPGSYRLRFAIGRGWTPVGGGLSEPLEPEFGTSSTFEVIE